MALDKNFRNKGTEVTYGSETTWAEGEVTPKPERDMNAGTCTGWEARTVADTEGNGVHTVKSDTLLGRMSQSDGILTTTSWSVQHCLVFTTENKFESIFQETLLLEMNLFLLAPVKQEMRSKFQRKNFERKILFCGFIMKKK